MEINDDSKIRIQWYAEMANQGKRMSKEERDARRGDEVEIRTRIPEKLNLNQQVREDKVARAKANIESGHYDEPEVVDEIVDRLLDQFGL
jgi:anti-sigma28 factor (negative regulator of flagellin synthesis)